MFIVYHRDAATAATDPRVLWVGPGSAFTNPHRPGDPHPDTGHPMTPDDTVTVYRALIRWRLATDPAMLSPITGPACYAVACPCPHGQPTPTCVTQPLLEEVFRCPCCEDTIPTVTPLDPGFGLCWACVPCACGQQCGFASYSDSGVKTCEVEYTQPELDAIRQAHLERIERPRP